MSLESRNRSSVIPNETKSRDEYVVRLVPRTVAVPLKGFKLQRSEK